MASLILMKPTVPWYVIKYSHELLIVFMILMHDFVFNQFCTSLGILFKPQVANGAWQQFCIAISQMSAFSMYPMIVIVFITKMKALQAFLVKTPLLMFFFMLEEAHNYHGYAGTYIACDIWVHILFHILCWDYQVNIKLLWNSAAGLTGLITMVATPLITFPMMYCKSEIIHATIVFSYL